MDMQRVVDWWLVVSHCSLLFIHCIANMFYTDTATVVTILIFKEKFEGGAHKKHFNNLNLKVDKMNCN